MKKLLSVFSVVILASLLFTFVCFWASLTLSQKKQLDIIFTQVQSKNSKLTTEPKTGTENKPETKPEDKVIFENDPNVVNLPKYSYNWVPWTPFLAYSTKKISWSNFLWINAQLHWFNKAEYEKQIELYKKLGLNWVRLGINWDTIEKDAKWNYVTELCPEYENCLKKLDEVVNYLDKNGINTMFYVVGSAKYANGWKADSYPPTDISTYTEFVKFLVQRYPSVDIWQVWNEENTPAFWSPKEDTKKYLELFSSSYTTIKSIDNTKPVSIWWMAYYSQMPNYNWALMLEELYKYGLWSFDSIISYHPYSQYPEENEKNTNDFIMFSYKLNSLLRDAGAKNIYATEWWWSSYNWPVEEQAIIWKDWQADYTLKRLALMSVLGYEKIFLFTLSDLDERATVRDRSYGLIDLQWNTKPVYIALKNFLEVTWDELIPLETPDLWITKGKFYGISWQKSDGTKILMYWWDSTTKPTLKKVSEVKVYNPLDGTYKTVTWNTNTVLPVNSSLQIAVYK